VTQVEPEPDSEHEESAHAPSRRLLSFKAAMLSYAALALLGTVTLNGRFRIFILIVLAGVALKTYVHHLKERVE
jgi:hypothetical protein